MGKKIHFLKNIDTNNRTAICSFCGPVNIKKCGVRWACRIRYNLWRRNRKLKWRYKITDIPDKKTNCEICGSDERKIVFDHNHKSGEFRGWICGNCNTAIGLFKENIDSMKRAIEYLSSH